MAATQKNRLGRGLGSLISGGVDNAPAGKASSNGNGSNGNGRAHKSVTSNGRNGKNGVVPENKGEFQEIPASKVVPNPHQPRKNFDDSEIADLVASIRAEGLLQPIVVREVDGKYQLIAGERRLRAIKKLRKPRISARIIKADDQSSAALSLVENLQRTDLNPMEESRGYNSLMQEFGLTQEKVSGRIGKSRTYVANSLRLLQLDGEIQGFLASATLSVGHAKVLLGLPLEADRLTLAKRIVDEGLSVRAAEAEVRILKGEESAIAARIATPAESATAIPKPAQVVRFEKALGEKLAAGVSFKHGSADRGRIVIDYRGLEDLERIMGALGV